MMDAYTPIETALNFAEFNRSNSAQAAPQNHIRVIIESSDTVVAKWHRDEPDVEFSEAQSLGFVLAAALNAVRPARLEEVLGHCITALADYSTFDSSRALPAATAIDELCQAADRIVKAWEQHDQALNRHRKYHCNREGQDG